MLPIRKVIFPVDYSECSVAAVPFVKELVQRHKAELTLVHASGWDEMPLNDMGLTFGEIVETARSIERERLQTFARDSFAGIDVKVTDEIAEPAGLIRAVAKSEVADLIMLPTHGRGIWRRMLLGSVATKVLHDLTTPIWTATPAALEESRTPYRSVLCACDINDTAEAAPVVMAAAGLACKYDASLLLLHVVEITPLTSEIDYPSFREALVESANVRLGELKHSLGVMAPHQIEEGPISAAIQRVASEHNVDLIVTGRGHQQGAVSRVWSSLYETVREAPCPVISL